MVTVSDWVFSIKFINNPSEKVIKLAIKKNKECIRYIKNPTEEIQLAAVKENGEVIKWIENPSKKVQMASVKQDAWAIYWILNPTEKVQLVALENCWNIEFYKKIIKPLSNKTEWFYRELNRLKPI